MPVRVRPRAPKISFAHARTEHALNGRRDRRRAQPQRLVWRPFPEIDQGEGLFVGSRSRLQPLKRLVDVAWTQVPKDQVLSDAEKAIAIVKHFYETGERLDSVRWISERF